MRIGNGSYFDVNTPTDMSASFASNPLWLGHICNYSIQLEFTGSPNGTFKLQMSNDPGQPSQQPLVEFNYVKNWTDIKGSDQVITASGDHSWNVQDAGYRWVRFVWTRSSGSGTLINAEFNIKGV
jgi:hypothetical protein